LPPLQPFVEPVLYQHLTDKIFEILVQEYYHQEHLDPEVTSMQQNERSVLRYITGYTCRHLCKKIEKENDEIKEEMVLCLMTLIKDRDESGCETDEKWANSLDRGGLWHVKESTYQLFCAD